MGCYVKAEQKRSREKEHCGKGDVWGWGVYTVERDMCRKRVFCGGGCMGREGVNHENGVHGERQICPLSWWWQWYTHTSIEYPFQSSTEYMYTVCGGVCVGYMYVQCTHSCVLVAACRGQTDFLCSTLPLSLPHSLETGSFVEPETPRSLATLAGLPKLSVYILSHPALGAQEHMPCHAWL